MAPCCFEPISLRDVTLKNRVVVAPMHQYAAVKALPRTGADECRPLCCRRRQPGDHGIDQVEQRGCGTVGDLGIWDDAFVPGLRRCVEFIRKHNSVPASSSAIPAAKARQFRPWEGRAAHAVARDRRLGRLGAGVVERAAIRPIPSDPRALTRQPKFQV